MNFGKSTDSESTRVNTRVKIRVRPRARKDIASLLACLAAERPAAAVRFDERLEEAKDLLARMPLSGRMARSARMLRKGYRCFVLDDYLLYYKAEGDTVRIWHVTHSVRRPPYAP